jgi:tRNA (guanine-N(7)-)-methyltransferase subunit TRM82
LLLGHVSMLTDLILAAAEAPAPTPASAPASASAPAPASAPNPSASVNASPDPSAKTLREHIITCDRDEHIRVSRGIPQTHVIERYCLGHTEFVSRLFVPPGRPELLLSGGGDDYIYIWNWQSGVLRHRLDLRCILNACWKSSSRCTPSGRKDNVDPTSPAAGTGSDTPDDVKVDTGHATSFPTPSAPDSAAAEDEDLPVAVSGIWGFDRGDGGNAGPAKEPAIVIACEG